MGRAAWRDKRCGAIQMAKDHTRRIGLRMPALLCIMDDVASW